MVPLPEADRREHLAESLRAFDFELGASGRELDQANERFSSLGELPYG